LIRHPRGLLGESLLARIRARKGGRTNIVP